MNQNLSLKNTKKEIKSIFDLSLNEIPIKLNQIKTQSDNSTINKNYNK